MDQLITGSILEINALCLRIGTLLLLDNFSLCLSRGRRIGITGPSGCGKTTLLRSIVRGRPPAGSSFDRFSVGLAAEECIGYAPQSGGLLPWYSLRRNLLKVVAKNGSETARHAAVTGIAQVFGLSRQLDQYPSKLSGGEMQRSILAGSIVLKPSLFLADEPLTEVDLRAKWALLNYWSIKIKELEAALVIVSHDVDVLLYLCDEIIVLAGEKPSRESHRFEIPSAHPRKKEDIFGGSAHAVRQVMMSEFLL